MKITIKNRFTGEPIYEADHDSLRAALEDCARMGRNLPGASLSRASLSGANLSGATANKWTRWPDGFTVPASVVTL